MLNSISTVLFGDMVCALVLIALSSRSSKQFRILAEERFFLEIILSALIMIVADVISALVSGSMFAGAKILNGIVCGIYLFEMSFIGFLWLIYVDYKLNRLNAKKDFKTRVFNYAIPMAVLLVLIISSQQTHIIYYIDEANIYHKGRLYIIQVIVMVFYIFYPTVLSLIEARKQVSREARKEKNSLSMFAEAALICAILQNFASDLPLISVGITVSILVVYLRVQTKQIYVDTLTGINNRRQLNIFLEEFFGKKKHKGKTFILMMDIDSFKQINDNYGHLEGDYALIKIAEILKNICSKNNDFVARFGGDEFAIVANRSNEAEIEGLKNEIKLELNIENKSKSKEYELSLSIGSAELFPEEDTIETAILKADEQLYIIKQNRKRIAEEAK
ncbi:MAG: GGDEF domain-containing protein [Ruminococcaceae bacterium]|nr:GGDEF domain-containing protein [Oscillospiraceae bacterium]